MKTLAGDVLRALSAGDHRLMRRVNRWPAPIWVRIWMVAATRAGDGWLWWGVGLLVLAFGGPRRFTALATAAITDGIAILIFRQIKKRINRMRPCEIEEHCWSTVEPPEQFSFPSGHTITAFVMAGTLGWFYPGAAPALYFCACSIAASRVVLGMHYVSDVLAGAALGGVLAVVSCQIVGRL